MINLAKDDETWRIELKTLSSQRRKSTQIGVFFALLTKFILLGEGIRKTNEYLNWSFRALHPIQPRDLLHEILTKMSSAESPDNQPIGTSANMEVSVWVREQLCMDFFVGIKAPLPNSWNCFAQTISYLVLAVVVARCWLPKHISRVNCLEQVANPKALHSK